MLGSFYGECKIVPVENSVGAGTATTVGEIVDTQGYNGACFIYKLGAVTDGAGVKLTIYQGTDSSVSDVAEIEGANAEIETADSDSDQFLVVDIVKPQERYLRPTIVTDTQNVEIDSAICILYNPQNYPIDQPDEIDDYALVISPDEA